MFIKNYYMIFLINFILKTMINNPKRYISKRELDWIRQDEGKFAMA